MAVNIITKFVLGQFAKKSAKKTGISKLLKSSDPIVQSNVKNIEIILKNMGIDSKNLKSTDDVLKHMNIHKAMMDQSLKQEFKGLGLGKGIKSLEKATKKDPFQGWTPKVVEGGGTSADDFLKLKQDTFRRLMTNTDDDVQAFTKRVINNQQDVKFEKLSKDQKKDMLNMIQDRIRLGNRKFMDEYKDLDVGFDPDDFASGGIARTGYFAGLIAKGAAKAGMGKFTKSEVLIQMLENTLKGSKDAYVKKTFPNFIKELQKNPKLALDANVWGHFTKGLPKNQRLIVHSDDTVDFFTQSEFGPHNIQKTLDFQKKHNLSREQANKILRMEPEDRVLEMKRLETIRNRTKQASGGRVSYTKGGLAKILEV